MFWSNHVPKKPCALFSVLQVSGEQFYADVAKDILLYVSRDLSDKVNVLQICQEVCVSLQAFCLFQGSCMSLEAQR